MASSAQVSVADSATKILRAPYPPSSSDIIIYNAGAVTVYLGASDVATSTGLAIVAGQYLPYTLDGGEELYGIVASGTCVVHVLY